MDSPSRAVSDNEKSATHTLGNEPGKIRGSDTVAIVISDVSIIHVLPDRLLHNDFKTEPDTTIGQGINVTDDMRSFHVTYDIYNFHRPLNSANVPTQGRQKQIPDRVVRGAEK
jgi:hypothetical protein